MLDNTILNHDLFAALKQTLEESRLKNVNVLVVGKTGVGKSTLLNAVFGKKIAEVGVGKPVTQNFKEFSTTAKGQPITIIDSKGLELADYNQITKELDQYIQKKKTQDAESHVHIAWLCVDTGSDRFEEAEVHLLQMLKGLGLPVILVMTKGSFNDQADEFKSTLKELSKLSDDLIIQVRAEETHIPELGVSLPLKAIDTLVDKTITLLPDAQKNAFAAAQVVSRELKRKASESLVLKMSVLAGAAGTSPIPFSDAALIAPVQVGMLFKITQIYGFEIKENFLKSLIAAAGGAAGASMVGRTLVTNLIKFVPGAGTVVGGAISATTASAITKAMGARYIHSLDKAWEDNDGLEGVTPEELFKIFTGFKDF